jgi:predicted AAA+ superfamily ATPase
MIRDILLIQKRELEKREKERYIERGEELKEIGKDIIKVIIGPRRAGKSFFLIHKLMQVGKFGYVNFDDERLIETSNYDEIIGAVNSLYGNPNCLLLDEIQNLDKWELFVNRLQRQGYELYITGSNSNLLSKELATHLTGRHLEIVLFPFSFSEYIRSQGVELTDNEKKEKLFEYLSHGGYPEPLVKDLSYRDYLSTLFDSIIYKDIVKRYKIRSVQGIADLATYLVSNTATEFSYNTLANVSKCKSVHTVEKYLKYLEEAFIFFKIKKFSYKVKGQLTSNKKIYCTDNGFVYAKAFKFKPDHGKLFENTVATELKKLEMKKNIEVYYWKSQNAEVDFLIKKGNKVTQLIQVCVDLTNIKTKEREVRALINASKDLGCKDLLVISGDYEGAESVSWFGTKRKIKFIPLWKWLFAL